MDKGLFNGVLFLDFKKAFDIVNHSILLRKHEQYEITGQLTLCLKNRKQVGIINNIKSDQESVQCGVPLL